MVGTLVLEPGTEVHGNGFKLAVGKSGTGGSLIAEGTIDAPIVFGAEQTVPDSWIGLFVYEGGSAVLEEVVIEKAGAYDNFQSPAALVVEGDVDALGVTIADTGGYGLAFQGGSMTGGDIAFVANDAPIRVRAALVDGLPTGLSFADNERTEIDVLPGTIVADALWLDHGIPYVVDGDLDVDSDTADPVLLTLEPGVDLRFDSGRGLYIGGEGAAALHAVGTSDAPIRIGPAAGEQPGAWTGVAIWEYSDDALTVLDYIDIGYAGAGWPMYGGVDIQHASPTIDHAVLHDSASCGMHLIDADPVLGELTFSGNAEGDICE